MKQVSLKKALEIDDKKALRASNPKKDIAFSKIFQCISLNYS